MDLVDKKVAVVGGAGFIGLHICRELIGRGAKVHILDRMLHPGSYKVAESIAPLTMINVIDTELDLKGFDIVLNLATRNVRESLIFPIVMCSEINAIGSVVPYKALRDKVSRYVYVSSSEIYGDATHGGFHEGSLPQPKTAYGVAKLAGEHYARCVQVLGLATVVVRPFNAYGPGCHLHGSSAELIARVVQRHKRGEEITVHGHGLQTRDFTHVRDLARGIVDATAHDACVNTGPINLCSGEERSVIDVIGSLSPEIKTVNGPGRPGDLTRQVGDASKAATILGWSPTISWEDGLQETVSDIISRSRS